MKSKQISIYDYERPCLYYYLSLTLDECYKMYYDYNLTITVKNDLIKVGYENVS